MTDVAGCVRAWRAWRRPVSSAIVSLGSALAMLSLIAACNAGAGTTTSITDGGPVPITDSGRGGNDLGPVVLKQDVQIAPDSVAQLAVVSDDEVAFPGSSAEWARGLAEGDVIASDRGPEATNPFGFLRRVVALSVEEERVVASTAPATLADAIESGGVRTKLLSTVAPLLLIPGEQEAFELVQEDLLRVERSFDFTFRDRKHTGTVAAQAGVEPASYRFDPVFDIDLRFAKGKLEYALIEETGNLQAKLVGVASVSATLESSFSREDKGQSLTSAFSNAVAEAVAKNAGGHISVPIVNGHKMLPTVFIGPLPVAFSVGFDIAALRANMT